MDKQKVYFIFTKVNSFLFFVEHRNLTLEDGYHIILTNFCAYKEHIRNNELNKNVETIIYPAREVNHQDQSIPFIGSTITLGDKLPLSMLLCLLADGRQLTLDEIDRVLVYLLEKKSKMLTLPQGTLPPLPAQYATIKKGWFFTNKYQSIFYFFSHQIKSQIQQQQI